MKRVIWALSVIMLVTCSWLAYAETGEESSTDPGRAPKEAAMVLMREFAKSDNPSQWFEANKSRINRDLANAADQIALEALKSHKPNLANTASIFAAFAHLQLRERDLAMVSWLRAQEIRFMLANQPAEYAGVREFSLKLISMANSIGRKDLAFQASVQAADSSYFQGEATADPKAAQEQLLITLQDIDNALPLAPYGTRVVFEKFVSLIGGTVNSATSQYTLTQKQKETLLKKLTPQIEQLIPPDFAYKDPNIGDKRKTIETARALARLSYLYGNPAVGNSRLAIAEERAKNLEQQH